MKKLIYRMDDFGSARAANTAILEGLRTGTMIRNVSVMPPCACVEEGAEELKRYSKQIDIGMHFTITSEWDQVKWGPVLEETQTAGVTDTNGWFKAALSDFAKERVDLDQVILECSAQLDKLTRLGLPIVYVDSHMALEMAIPGLQERFRTWIASKGLIDAYDYYRLDDPSIPAYAESEEDYLDNVETWVKKLPEDIQIWTAAHPAVASNETMLFVNTEFPKGIIMNQRHLEYRSVISSRWEQWQAQYDLKLLRYSEAEPVPNGETELKKLFGF